MASVSYHIFKNGKVVAVDARSSVTEKINVAHGNPAGKSGVIGKFGSKVNSTGPISSK